MARSSGAPKLQYFGGKGGISTITPEGIAVDGAGQLWTFAPDGSRELLTTIGVDFPIYHGRLEALLGAEVVGWSVDKGFGFSRSENGVLQARQFTVGFDFAELVGGVWREISSADGELVEAPELLLGTVAFLEEQLYGVRSAIKLLPGRRGRRSPLAGWLQRATMRERSAPTVIAG